MQTVTRPGVPVPASWIAPEILKREGLGIEPVVMLEEVDGKPAVRKLTMRETVAYADRTGGSVFAGSDEEFDETFELLAEQADAEQRH